MAVAAVALPLDSEGPAAAVVHFAARADAVSLRLPQADPPCQLPASPSYATNPVVRPGRLLASATVRFQLSVTAVCCAAGDQPDC